MKKTLRSILACALAFVAVACYDDSALQNKVNDLDERLTVVEQSLSSEVNGLAALLTKIDELKGKIAAVKVETVDGVTTLSLSDGSKVVLAKNGALTIDGDNWATVAPDGNVTTLPVKVGHDLDFKVENGELKVSYDGTTYEATGVKISEYTAHVIGDVAVAQDGKSVTITIGGNSVELPLVSSAVATLGLSRDSFFLYYGAEKTITITAEGLSDIYVMNEPDGWKASIEGAALVVTAPSAKAADADAAAKDGLVLVHATTEEGKCVVAKLEVSTGKGLSVEIDNDVLTFRNAYVEEAYDYWGEPLGSSFTNFAIGMVPAAYFLEDPKAYVDYYVESYGYPEYGEGGFMYNNYNKEYTPYEEGVYEVDQITYTIDELSKWMLWDTDKYPGNSIETGVEYVIWIAPVNERGEANGELVEFVTYTKMKVDFSVSGVTHNDAVLTVDVAGAEKYFYGMTEDPAAMYGTTIEEYMQNMDPWAYMIAGQAHYIENFYVDGTYELNLSDLNGYYGPEPLTPGTKYYYWVIPYNSGVAYTDYATQCAPYIKEFTTAALVAGGPDVTAVAGESECYAVNVDVTVPDSTTVYYNFYEAEEWAEFDENDEAILAALIGNYNYNEPITESAVISEEVSKNGETRIFAAVAITSNGQYGNIATLSLETKEIVTAPATVSLVSVKEDGSNYVAVLSVQGATNVCGYYVSDSDYNRSYYAPVIVKNILTDNLSYGYQVGEVVDNQVTLTFAKNQYKTDYYVYAYNVENGAVVNVASEMFVFNIDNSLVKLDGRQWITAMEETGVFVDFGVKKSGMSYSGYADLETLESVMGMSLGEYTITATDETSGTINIAGYDMYGEPATLSYKYKDLTATSVSIDFGIIYGMPSEGEEISYAEFTRTAKTIVFEDMYENM